MAGGLVGYAELQRGEAAHAHDHLAHGVPDLRVATLPARYEDLVRRELPLEPSELGRLRGFAPRFVQLCDELAAHQITETVQHDDLHMANVYAHGGRLRLLDWGDTSIAHPFTSLVVAYRFLEVHNRLAPTDPWFGRLRDAYLEPWGGRGLAGVFALAMRVGAFAHAVAWARQRDYLPEAARPTTTGGSRSCCGARSPGSPGSRPLPRGERGHRTMDPQASQAATHDGDAPGGGVVDRRRRAAHDAGKRRTGPPALSERYGPASTSDVAIAARRHCSLDATRITAT